jgi:putative glycosyl hydrolase-like family 15 (GHL15) protein
VASGSGPSKPAPSGDQHAFPRTLSFLKCSPAEARYDMIVGYAYCSISEVRKLNPKGIFLLQPGLSPGAADYGGMSVTYGTGLWYWREGYAWKDGGCDTFPGGVKLGCIRQFIFDYDQMYNADGSLAGIDNGKSGTRGWNLSDPLGRGTRELVAKFIAYIAKLDGIYAKGWDGIFSDNWIYGVIGQGFAYGPSLDTDRDGAVDDYPTLRKRWDDGLNEVGNRIRSYLPGKIVIGNGNWYGMAFDYHGSDPQGWLKGANGTMVESIERFYNSSNEAVKIASRWLGFRDTRGQTRYLLFLQNALDNKGNQVRIGPKTDPNDPKYMLDPGVMRSMRWGLTLALMAGAYYELHLDSIHDTRWWYDEYDGGKAIRQRGYLGQAVTRPIQVRPGVWRRHFERGIALNNSTSKSATIDLKKPYRHLRGSQNPSLNDGRAVTRINLPAHDGLILLNVKQEPKPKK